MKVYRFWGFVAAVALAAAPALAAVRTVEQETKIVDGFIEAVKGNKELAADQVQKAVDAAAALKTEDEGRPIAITEGLREIYPAFREALKAVSEENLAAAGTALADLTGSFASNEFDIRRLVVEIMVASCLGGRQDTVAATSATTVGDGSDTDDPDDAEDSEDPE
jgi:hypothetical protein